MFNYLSHKANFHILCLISKYLCGSRHVWYNYLFPTSIFSQFGLMIYQYRYGSFNTQTCFTWKYLITIDNHSGRFVDLISLTRVGSNRGIYFFSENSQWCHHWDHLPRLLLCRGYLDKSTMGRLEPDSYYVTKFNELRIVILSSVTGQGSTNLDWVETGRVTKIEN